MEEETEAKLRDYNRLGSNVLLMPATEALFGHSTLDDIEAEEKSALKFLKKSQENSETVQPNPKNEKNTTVERVQGDWSTLESVVANDKDRPATPPRKTAKDWHEIPVVRMTPELEKDLRLIENRNHLDPKRFYKSSGTGRKPGELPSRVHVGTVVVGAHEFYSGRLTKRERRKTFTDEVMSDERVQQFTKTRYRKLQTQGRVKKRVIDPAAKKKKRRSAEW